MKVMLKTWQKLVIIQVIYSVSEKSDLSVIDKYVVVYKTDTYPKSHSEAVEAAVGKIMCLSTFLQLKSSLCNN